jgi:pimeloyl-ACP methyl ester carboxylesterase
MAYVDMGNGPPVVLLHGFPTSANLWRREAWLMAQRMRVIAPDFIGYGQSARPADADLSEPAQAEYVRELLERLGVERFAVVGHDIGGAIAQMLALGGILDVRAMVLLDAASFDAWPATAVEAIQATLPDQESGATVERCVRDIFSQGIAHGHLVDTAELDAYVTSWTGDPGAFFRAARGVSGKGLAGRDAELERLDLPTLVVWGEVDPYLNVELAERLGDAIPFSTVALLPGCSHFVTQDAPQTVGPLIYEFLRLRYLGEAHGPGPHEGPVRVFLERPPPEEA